MKKTIKNYLYSIIIILIITNLSLIKTDSITPSNLFEIPNLDKVIHIIMYYSLTFSLLLENANNFREKKIESYFFFLFSVSFGILMELSQKILTNYRSYDILDILSNSTGALLALIIFQIFYKKINNSNLLKWIISKKNNL